MYKLYLFLKRLLVTSLSYRVSFILGLLGGFVALFQFSFVGKFISDGNSFPAISQYGGNVLSYFIIGGAFQVFVGTSLNSFHRAIRSEQNMGTLEYLLLSNTRLEVILSYSGLVSFFKSFVNTSLMLVAVFFFLSIPLRVNLLAAAVTVGLMICALSGIGLMSAGIIIVTKVGDPINWAFTTLTTFLSGVFFPVEYLPEWLHDVSYILPTTHALHALRMSLTQGAAFGEIMPELRLLSIMALVTLPLGFIVLRLGYNHACRVGSLSHY
jgi:ABC-2 type transport system permease protein